ncbi:unnamed protein product [Lota lota]
MTPSSLWRCQGCLLLPWLQAFSHLSLTPVSHPIPSPCHPSAARQPPGVARAVTNGVGAASIPSLIISPSP